MNEIEGYHEIFYLGQIAKKVKVAPPDLPNHGFDDSKHFYKANIGDQIAYRFEIRSVIGQGSFGQVLRCYDHKLKVAVALKVLVNTGLMHEQGRVECYLLQHLNKADSDNSHHIIRGIESFVFRAHICIATEIMGQNLYEYVRAMRFRPLPARQVRPIARQILEALAFVHANNVVHCDMKPENVLLEPGTVERVKVIDFGSGCISGTHKFEYIQSRFYRAPEVVFGLKYGPPMDVWSFACIIIELMIGNPIFPGDSERELLELCTEILGPPPKELVAQAPRKPDFFAADGSYIPAQAIRSRKSGRPPLEYVFGPSDPLALDLFRRCLDWDQTTRITAAEALNHPWLSVKEIQICRASGNHILPGLIR
jgi:dual specificity tyrosine-phosphorylation-regulated kinase 2/3/4